MSLICIYRYETEITKYSEYRFIGVLDAKTLKTILF